MFLVLPTLLCETSAAAGHSVSKITLNPPTPNILVHGDEVHVSFSYSTTEPGGVRIFARPYVGKNRAPGYASSGAVLSPTGSGTSKQYFTITRGSVKVNRIKFEMYNDDQTKLLFEIFLPVYYEFVAP